jgi:glycosyltransferase involved in cell wall biosynthesis
MSEGKLRVLMELRPALEGYAGIPQETRLLFRGLSTCENIELEGLLLTSFRKLARGTTPGWFGRVVSPARRINRYSRVVVSLSERPFSTPLGLLRDFIGRRSQTAMISLATLLGLSRIGLTRFESRYFEDFVWRTLFSKSLPASDFGLVTAKNHRICSIPWDSQQKAGLVTLLISRFPRFPRLNTFECDIFVAQTPYPARVAPSTAMVVRYHDAIPIFMPHTIPNKSKHQAHHFYSLLGNVRAGAYFACVSDASREALNRVFPEAAERAVTIHNMVSAHYYREDSSPERVPQIIRNRLDRKSELTVPKFRSLRESSIFYDRVLAQRPFRYLLVVSTVEPRKNHSRLLAAWEIIRAEADHTLKLVIVGGLGWDYEMIMREFRAAIDQGDAFFLNNVPAADLRVLYRHALITVCPSLAEGFDYSGIEAMRSGGLVVASDIPVHREVYADAAEYFDPYSTNRLAHTLGNLLAPPGAALCAHLRERGSAVSARYLPEHILPQWQVFFERVMHARRSS